MKYIYIYSIILLFITTPLSYADKKIKVQNKVAALEKTTATDNTGQTVSKTLIEKLKKEPAEQLINYLQCPGKSKKQLVTAVHLFEKRAIRNHNTQQLKKCFNSSADFALFLSALASALPKITSNDSFIERAANGDNLTQEDFEFVRNIFITQIMHELFIKNTKNSFSVVWDNSSIKCRLSKD